MYKLLITLSLFIVAQGGETPIRSTLEQLSKKCISHSNAPADSFKLLGGRTVPSVESEQCFLECIYRGMKLITNDKLNAENAKNLANNRYKTKGDLDMAYRVIDTCSTVKPEDDLKCGLGVAIRKCILDFGEKNKFYLQP